MRLLRIAIYGYILVDMDSTTNLYGYVMACIDARAIPQRQVAAGAGVQFSTVAKIAQRAVADPSVHTVQKLADYFVSQGVKPTAEHPEAA